MYSSYLCNGSVAILYELSKSDGIFQQNEAQSYKRVFLSDLPLYARFIQENMLVMGDIVQECNELPQKTAGIKLCEMTKHRFLSILSRVGRAHEGISRQERIFIQQIWYEIQRVYFAAIRMQAL